MKKSTKSKALDANSKGDIVDPKAITHDMQAISAKRSWKKIIGLAGGSFILLFLIAILLFGTVYQQQNRKQEVSVGVSFSKTTAEEYGLDWQQTFTQMLDDLGARRFRLVSHWDKHETENNSYNFEDLDWQMDEAAKRGAKVNLAVGLRQPRWPECHQPQWAKDLYNSDKAAWETELNEYIAKVVDRYKNHSALYSWHLENEYFNRNFGDCQDFSRQRLQQELELIKTLDKDHEIILALADQLGFPFLGPKPDTYATSLYKGNYLKGVGYIEYPIPSQYYSFKAFWAQAIHGRKMSIHELQLEPWGPKPTAQLSSDEQIKYMSLEQMEKNLKFAEKTAMQPIDLWGVEWWYWRKVTFNDPSQWQIVKDFLEKYQT